MKYGAEQLQTAEPDEVTAEQNKCHLAEAAADHCEWSDRCLWSFCWGRKL